MSLLEKKMLEGEFVAEATYRKASRLRRKYGGTTPLNLVRMNAIDEDRLLGFIVEECAVTSVSQEELGNTGMSVVNLIPLELAKRFRIIPFRASDDVLRIVMSDPTDEKIIDELAFITGKKVEVFAAYESVISWALLKYYGFITESEIPAGDDEDTDEEIPVPLVTRRKSSSPPPPRETAGERVHEEAPVETRHGGAEPGEELREMGDWEAPFDLSRTSTIDIVPPAEEAVERSKERPGRYKRKTPTKVAIPSPRRLSDAVREEEEARDRRGGPGSEEPAIVLDEVALEAQRGAHGETVKAGGPAVEAAGKAGAAPRRLESAEKRGKRKAAEVPAAQEVAEKAEEVEEKKEALRPERDSSVSVAKVFIIGSSSAVAETIGRTDPMPVPHEEPPPPPRREPAAAGPKKQTFPPPPPTKGIPAKSIDRSRVGRWASFINTLTDTEKVIERTLSFLDTVFGPTIFLKKTREGAQPFRFSLSVPRTEHDRLKRTVLKPPSFELIWKSLEKGEYSFAKVASDGEYKPLVEVNVDAGWESEILLLMVPVVIGTVHAGILVSVPTSEWEDTPELREAFDIIEKTLSKVFEKIIMERKKGTHGS